MLPFIFLAHIFFSVIFRFSFPLREFQSRARSGARVWLRHLQSTEAHAKFENGRRMSLLHIVFVAKFLHYF